MIGKRGHLFFGQPSRQIHSPGLLEGVAGRVRGDRCLAVNARCALQFVPLELFKDFPLDGVQLVFHDDLLFMDWARQSRTRSPSEMDLGGQRRHGCVCYDPNSDTDHWICECERYTDCAAKDRSNRGPARIRSRSPCG